MNILNSIKENLKSGVYKQVRRRYSPSIAVTDGRLNLTCIVSQDDIFDKNENLLYQVEKHIGTTTEYFTYDIFDYKLKRSIESKHHNREYS